ncbi:nuclear factor of activated T-cells 5 isoform X2 [Euwallacea fornicatus]|uniref:nuclear factor of activated T-cells 5 isoform X2 n=1 Tax=Euwallacea fornicatus TaxID=995702 RepID=UPI0033900B65
MSKLPQKLLDKKVKIGSSSKTKQETSPEGSQSEDITAKNGVEKKGKTKSHGTDKESLKMTLCTQPTMEAPRPQRRAGRPSGGKKMIARDMPGKLRSACRRSIDPCDNSNDSGLGLDHHVDPHHHTMTMSERLTWTGERAEAKRLRMDIKVENEEVNDNYCFPDSALQCKDNLSLIRTVPGGTIPSLSLSGNSSTPPGRTVPRCAPVISRQAPTAPVALSTQLTSASRFSDVALTIVKQPEQQHRARYQTEGSRGAVKDREGNGFPIVQLTGYYKPAVLQVYIGTDVGKVTPHMFYQACKVSGKNSTPCVEKKIEGTCVIELALEPAKEMCATCDCVGILKERNVDVEHRFPEQLGNRSKKKSTRCRMIFRTTITHDNGSTETLQVCSQPIVCTQPPGIPEICKKSLTSCPASGGLELFVLGKNFLKDTKIFFQQFEDGRVCWEQAVAPDKEYLQQTHFVCVVPAYRTSNITEPVLVRLCVVSSGKTSESHQFVYTPVNGTVSAHVDAHAQHAQTFKGALWNSTFHKRQQDLDMMPPPETSLVPLATRRSSVSLPSTSNSRSPPLKQEYVDENSQSSMSDSMDGHSRRYRLISESSLDVNHDSNLSMINDNSVDLMHQDSLMSHLSDNSNLSVNEESVKMVRCDSVSTNDNAVMSEGHSIHPDIPLPSTMPVEKVMDLRMKLPMNSNVTDFVTTASSMVLSTLKRFGIEHPTEPLPPQSAQSVETYLTNIESKTSLLPLNVANKVNEEKIMAMSSMMASQPTVFPASQQPFLSESDSIRTIAKSEAAAIAEQIMTGTTTTSNACTTLTTSLGGSISTPINAEKLDELLNTTLESHIGTNAKTSPLSTSTTLDPIVTTRDMILVSESSLLGPPVINTSPLLSSQSSHSPETILNTQLSPSVMCRSSPSVHAEPLTSASLSAMCIAANTTDSNLLPSSIPANHSPLLPAVANPESTVLLCSESEKAVIFEATVDFLKTQKGICELATTSPDIIGIASASSDTSPLPLTNTIGSRFLPFTGASSELAATSVHVAKSRIATADQIDKKNEDRMIPRSFPSLTENELISLINPSCFDQV